MDSINISIHLNSQQHTVVRQSSPKLYSNLEIYKKRFIESDRSNFIRANADLINFINQDSDLKAILKEKTIKGRDDLKDVIITGAIKKLDSNSPVTRKFLEEHLDFAKFVAANIGKFADILNGDRELAKTIVGDGDVTGGTLVNHIANKVVSFLGSSSPVSKKFLSDYPEAAIHLLDHPYELSQVKTDRTRAERFVAEIGMNSETYKAEIVVRAKALIDMPSQFSTSFLEDNIKFAEVVVASELNGESLKLPAYLKTNYDLTLDSFTISDLIAAYQADLAESRFQGDYPFAAEFFLKNKALAAAVAGSEEFASNLKKEGSILEGFFGPRKTDGNINRESYSTIAMVYQSPFDTKVLQPLNIDLFM